MNSKEFIDLFDQASYDPMSVEDVITCELVQWPETVIPSNCLFKMINNDFVRGLEYYIKGYGEEYIEWTRGKVGPYEHIAVAQSGAYWWFFALNEDSSEGKCGQLNYEGKYTKAELLEGFVNYCARDGVNND